MFYYLIFITDFGKRWPGVTAKEEDFSARHDFQLWTPAGSRPRPFGIYKGNYHAQLSAVGPKG
jgi:hypothetical protein